jgi:ribosomal protein S18 acetylase RimI-like enzyme
MMTTIRSYESPDLVACRELWVVLTERHREIYSAPWIGGSDPGLQFDDHLRRVGAGQLWVAEASEAVVGLSGLILEDGGAELEPLVVAPEWRGMGIGGLLLAKARAAAIAAGATSFNVRAVARNAEAIQFYRAAGFNVLGFIEMFEDLREDSPARWVAGETIAGTTFLI